MIVGIVGGDRPFDRLVRTLDLWASRNPDELVCAQIGRGGYQPGHVEWVARLTPAWAGEVLGRASIVVTHASLDIVDRALRNGLPVLVLPRHPMFGEDSSDEQLVIADRLGRNPGVHVIEHEDDLLAALSNPGIRAARPNSPLALDAQLRLVLCEIASAEAP